jgi:hypothetical protein
VASERFHWLSADEKIREKKKLPANRKQEQLLGLLSPHT